MTSLSRYYISRAFVSIAFGSLFAFTGWPWWKAALLSAIAFAFFLWAPRSGRYSVHPELGITALRRDERTQSINDKASRNAFVVTGITLAGIAINFGNTAQASVPVAFLQLILILGALTYFLSDLWFRLV